MKTGQAHTQTAYSKALQHTVDPLPRDSLMSHPLTQRPSFIRTHASGWRPLSTPGVGGALYGGDPGTNNGEKKQTYRAIEEPRSGAYGIAVIADEGGVVATGMDSSMPSYSRMGERSALVAMQIGIATTGIGQRDSKPTVLSTQVLNRSGKVEPQPSGSPLVMIVRSGGELPPLRISRGRHTALISPTLRDLIRQHVASLEASAFETVRKETLAFF